MKLLYLQYKHFNTCCNSKCNFLTTFISSLWDVTDSQVCRPGKVSYRKPCVNKYSDRLTKTLLLLKCGSREVVNGLFNNACHGKIP